ncbi:MAG: hypothetical protein ACQEQF_10510 [Bacillota bacterium]
MPKVKVNSLLLLTIVNNNLMKKTEWVLEQLQEMISYRYDRDLPIVFTSNYKIKKFDELNHQKESINKQGERLYSKLRHMCENFDFRLEETDKRIKENRK